FPAGRPVANGRTEGHDSDRSDHANPGFWSAGGRYHGDDGAPADWRASNFSGRRRTHPPHAARAWLVTASRGPDSLFRLCGLRLTGSPVNQDLLAPDWF